MTKDKFEIGDIVKGYSSGTIFEILKVHGKHVDLQVMVPGLNNYCDHKKGDVIKCQTYTNYNLIEKCTNNYEIY